MFVGFDCPDGTNMLGWYSNFAYKLRPTSSSHRDPGLMVQAPAHELLWPSFAPIESHALFQPMCLTSCDLFSFRYSSIDLICSFHQQLSPTRPAQAPHTPRIQANYLWLVWVSRNRILCTPSLSVPCPSRPATPN